MIPSQSRDVGECDVPLSLDVRLSAGPVVGVSVSVAAQPKIDGPRILGQVALESLSVRLVVDEVQVRRAFWPSRWEVAMVMALEVAVRSEERRVGKECSSRLSPYP